MDPNVQPSQVENPLPQTPQAPTVPEPPTAAPVAPMEAPVMENAPVGPPVLSERKGSPILIVAVILAVIAVLAVVGYAVAGRFMNQQPTATVAPVATPSSTPNPTANWKTYISENYLFKYPTDWILTEQTDVAGKKTGNILLASPTTVATVSGYPLNIFVTDTKIASVSGYLKNLIAQNPVGQPGSLASYPQTQVVVGGQPAIKLTGVFAGDSSQNQVYVLFNGKIYEITFLVGQNNPNFADAEKNSIIASQVLSTFQFVTATPTPSAISTANWKTYSGKLYSFKYPQTYILKEGAFNDITLFDGSNLFVNIFSLETPTYSNFDNCTATKLAGCIVSFTSQTELVKDISVDGKSAKSFYYSGLGGDITYRHQIEVIEKPAVAIQAILGTSSEAKSVSENKDMIFDQILSTFKFTQ